MPLVVRTRARNFDAVAREAAALHPYAVPSITATEFVTTAAYADWIATETGPS